MNQQFNATDRWSRAVVFACRHHGDQRRDDGRTFYAVHPIRVAEHLRGLADERDEDVLVAALLHDVIEDCGADFEDIADAFGPRVAGMVAELSNDNRLPKAQRREQMLVHAAQLSAGAKRIKLADRYDNTVDLLRGVGSREKRLRYCHETDRVLHGCAGACPPLEQALREVLAQLRDHCAWEASRETNPIS